MVDKAGTWYSYNGERLGQGRENAKTFLREHPEVLTEIELKLRQIHGLKFSPSPALAAAAE